MKKKALNGNVIAPTGLLSQSMRKAMALAAASALVLAPMAWADNRTALKPGWNMYSPQQDAEVGQQVSQDAERQLVMLNDSRVDNYLNTLGHRLSTHAPGYQFQYTYRAVNDRGINAFALPGGHVYINRGVIDAADNEAQLAGVMAHETSHVALRHGTNQASKASAAQMPLAILGGVLGSNSTGAMLAQLGAGFTLNSVLLKYSRSAESEADIMGTQILYDSGYDPRGLSQFLEKLQGLDTGGHQVAFFNDHPSPDRRVERVGEEVNNLGGAPRGSRTDSNEFQDLKRYVLSLPGPPARGSTQASQRYPGGGNRGQRGSPRLRIVEARYGGRDRFTDVRDLLQSRVRNERLDFRVTNASMGGDPSRGEAKTLRISYEWANNSYQVVVPERRQVSIPTADQQSGYGNPNDRETEWPSDRFLTLKNPLLQIDYPDNWQAYGQGDAATIAPRGGLVNDGNGNQALAFGVIVNIYQPQHWDRYNQQQQQLQGRDYGQDSRRGSATALDQATDQLIQELRQSNRNMRVIRAHEDINLNGEAALSTYLTNDSPFAGGARETNWLITVARADGLVFIVFVAPENEFQNYENTFQRMLRSVRVQR